MNCPKCGSKTYIVDSRASNRYKQSYRRRRVCYHCKTRFTTYEILPQNLTGHYNYCPNCGADIRDTRGEENGEHD